MKAPDWMPRRSTAANRKPAPSDGRVDLVAQLGGPDDLVGRQLHARDVAVVADAAVGEAETTHGALGGVHLAELLRGDLLEVRDARGEARRGGLVRDPHAQLAGGVPHHRLRHPGLGEGAQDGVLGGRTRAGAVGASRVVGVLAVGDRGEPEPGHELVVDAREQLVLAVEAPVGAVGAVGGGVALVSLDLDHARADLPGRLVRGLALVRRERGGDAEDRDDVVRPELLDREGEQRGGVATPPE